MADKKITAREHIESLVAGADRNANVPLLSLLKRRQTAQVVWGIIKDGSQSDAEIKEICKSKGFDTLLGELYP